MILRVQVTDDNENKLVKLQKYSGNQSQITVMFDEEDGLVSNANYSLIVIATSPAGNVTSETILFSKSFKPYSIILDGVLYSSTDTTGKFSKCLNVF